MDLRGLFARLAWIRWPRSRTARTLDWEGHYHAGASAFQEGRIAEAEKYLVAAFEDAEGFPAGDPRLSVSLDALAALYRLQGRHREAEPLCLRTLAIKEKTHGPSNVNVATTLKDLAEISRALGHADQAEAFQRRAFAILKAAIGPDFAELEESLKNSPILNSREDEPD